MVNLFISIHYFSFQKFKFYIDFVFMLYDGQNLLCAYATIYGGIWNVSLVSCSIKQKRYGIIVCVIQNF